MERHLTLFARDMVQMAVIREISALIRAYRRPGDFLNNLFLNLQYLP